MQMLSVETNAGTAIWLAPSRIARIIGFPIARLRWMFSISTVASSTRMPTARARPPSVMMFKVWPSAPRTRIEHKMDNGIDVATTRVLRQLPIKSRIMNAVRHAAIRPSRKTPLIEARTKIDWSKSWLISSSFGSVAWMRGSVSLTRLMISSVDALALFRTVSSADRMRFCETMLVCTANPSRT